MLKEILHLLDQACKLFQRDTLDIHQLKTMTSATKLSIQSFADDDPPFTADLIHQIEENSEYNGIQLTCNLRDRRELQQRKQSFIEHIVREFDDRFPDESLGILNDLNILLNPKLLPNEQDAIRQHGTDSLGRCLEKYGEGDNPVINAQNTRNSFLQFKYVVNTNREKDLHAFCSLVIKDYGGIFLDFVTLAAILTTCPLTSVPRERGLSLQNRHHCESSSRRTVANVESNMHLSSLVMIKMPLLLRLLKGSLIKTNRHAKSKKFKCYTTVYCVSDFLVLSRN